MKKNTLVVLALVATFGLGIFLMTLSPDSKQINPDIKGERILARPYSHLTGGVSAKAALVEFGDYQCPFCAQVSPFVKGIVSKYKDNQDFSFAYRHFPLPQHTSAVDAALAVEAAGAQGKFWEMNNLLYERQNDWSGAINAKSYFIRYASELDLDVERFESDMADQRHLDNVTQDKKDGEALGVNSTPTFFLNGQRLENIGDLEMEIDNLLKELSVEQE